MNLLRTLLVLLGSIPLASAFQPTFSSRAFQPNVKSSILALHNEVSGLEKPDKEKAINPLSQKIREVSTLVFASMVLLFSPMMEPSSVAWAADSSSQQESLLLQTSTKENEASVIDEVWNLVNKYYIDRSFNGQVSSVLCSYICKSEIHLNSYLHFHP